MRQLCYLCALCVGLTTAPFACAKPNVIVIVSDDAGWADFGFNRAATSQADPGARGAIPTPQLDQLASQGVAFTNAYGASVCAISRAMLTTGIYGNRFGFNNNIQDDATAINVVSVVQGLPLTANTIWERMQSVGYNTAAIGKWHLGQHANGGGQLGNRPENQGIEFFEGLLGGSRNYTVGGETGVAQTLRRTISNGAGTVDSTVAIESQFNGQYITDVLGDRSAQYIRDQATVADPFFMYSSFTAPHTPLQATAADLAYIDSLGIAGFTGTRRTQAAMQYALDRNVGKILTSLSDPNGDGNPADSIAENTLIMFVNDNGGDCCDVDPNSSSNGVLRNGKGSQYEGAYRVPFIVAGAGVALNKRGTVSGDIVSVIDMLPTAFLGAGQGALAGGESFDGVNLLPYINDTVSGVAHEELFYPRFSSNQSAIRRGDWKLMYQTNTGYQLYNLASDPDESNNVIATAANAAMVNDLKLRLAGYHVQMDKPRYDNQAPATNQFDHFRFREDAFTTASFSSAGAWVNAESPAGNVTFTSLDGYADNRLTFRAKVNGDYTLTNDLTSVGGFAYLTNEVNLASSPAPLVGNRTATINGAGLMMTATRAGVLPRINLDATDARPQAFTFHVEHDLELYDDLTIAGNGNQNFVFAGAIREFRPGRKLVKQGSADVTFAGQIDVSEAVDLQGGKVSFHDGAVRGDLVARSGVAVIVGQRGIVAGSGGGGSPLEIVQTGLELNYDAALDISGDAIWTNAASPADNLAFGGAASTVNVATSTFPILSKAYSIPTSGGASGLNNYFEANGPRSAQDATFEVVFNSSNLAAGTNQVLFEVGGAARGVAFVLNNNTLTFNVDGNASDINLNTPLTAGWHHAVGVIEVGSAGSETVSLFVDNQLVGTLSGQTIGDWAGGNTAGLGAGESSVTGVTTEPGSPFHSEIAVARYYANAAFTPAQVAQNHQWLLQTASNTTAQPPVTLDITGDFTLEAQTTLELDLASPIAHDKVHSSGAAQLNGSLIISAAANTTFAAGEMFEVLSASTLQGRFTDADLPVLPDGLMWQMRYNATSLTLLVTVAGDYNGDGLVGAADFTVWRDALGQTASALTGADGNGDGQITQLDYEVWRTNFGNQVASMASAIAVPEPHFAAFTILGGIILNYARHAQH